MSDGSEPFFPLEGVKQTPTNWLGSGGPVPSPSAGMERGWGTPSCARGLTSNTVIFQLVQTDGVKKEICGCEERHCNGAVVMGQRMFIGLSHVHVPLVGVGRAGTPNTRAPGGLRCSIRIRLEIFGLLESLFMATS